MSRLVDEHGWPIEDDFMTDEIIERKEKLLKQLEELLNYLYSHYVSEYEIRITDATQEEMPMIHVSFDQYGC